MSTAYSKGGNSWKKSYAVWLDYHGIIHFEFLNHYQALNADLYSKQLQHVHENLLKCHALIIWRNVVSS